MSEPGEKANGRRPSRLYVPSLADSVPAAKAFFAKIREVCSVLPDAHLDVDHIGIRLLDRLLIVDARSVTGHRELRNPIHAPPALQRPNSKQHLGVSWTELTARGVHADRPDAISIQVEDLLTVPRHTGL